MIPLILSLDYEIFGNGAGDVIRDVIEPTQRMLRICDRHGAKMTIMFEVGEYWAFEQFDAQLRQDLGYSPGEEMKRQVIDAVRQGHDLQLHLHPQWIGARYQAGVWELKDDFWRLADLPGGLGDTDQCDSITGALHRGKQTLEEMIRPHHTDYRCLCFRAGAFFAQPSGHIIAAMKKVGLEVDSSVVKGYRYGMPCAVDYSQVHILKGAWWTTATDLTTEGNPGENVLEVPVSAKMEPYWKDFKWPKLRAALKRRALEKKSSADYGKTSGMRSVPNCRTAFGRLFRIRANTSDFCKLSCNDLLKRTTNHLLHDEAPIVLIGHSKDFFNDRHFDRFLAKMRRRNDVQFQSFSEYIETVRVHDKLLA